LPEACDGLDLGVVVGEQVLVDAPQSLKDHGSADRQHREGEHEALDLPPYRLRIRPGLERSRAGVPGLGEDVRRERRGAAAD
jgi:hypothetical protein